MTSENKRSRHSTMKRADKKRSSGSRRSKKSSIQSKSGSRSRSRSPSAGAKKPSGKAFMCGKCIRPKSYLIPPKEEKPKKLKKEKLAPSVICPVHGHIELELDTELTPRTHKRDQFPFTDYDENVTIFVTKNVHP